MRKDKKTGMPVEKKHRHTGNMTEPEQPASQQVNPLDQANGVEQNVASNTENLMPAHEVMLDAPNLDETSTNVAVPVSLKAQKPLRALLQKIPPLPRFSDKGQERAAKNIVRFFAILLVVTLISRGTSGATMPKVKLVSLSQSEIAVGIKSKATVNEKDTIDITVPEGIKIEEVSVGIGQTVEKGQALATLDLEELTEAYDKKSGELDKMNLDLAKLLRDLGDDSTLSSALKKLLNEQDAYKKKQTTNEKAISDAKKAYDEVWDKSINRDTASIEDARKSYVRFQEDYPTKEAEILKTLQNAEQAYYDGLDTAPRAVDTAKKNLDNAKDTLDNLDSSDPLYKGAKNAVEDAREALRDAEKAYDRKLTELADALQAAREAYDKSLVDLRRQADDAKETLEKAVKADKDKMKDEADAVDKAKEALDKAHDDADEGLKSAEDAIEDAQDALDKTKLDKSDNNSQNQISIKSKQLEIDAQKKIVDQLKGLVDNKGVLHSGQKGVVSATAEAGTSTTKDPVVAFVDGSKGFLAKMKLDQKDANKLKVGNECEVTTSGGSMYYHPTVTATISSIANPTDDKKVEITVNLPSDTSWSRGESVDVQVLESKDIYYTCVSLASLHSDNSGYYVYVVNNRTTVLGMENVVASVPVEVEAKDDKIAAISGAIPNNEVIESSNKAIKAGDKVRIQEN